MLKNCLCQNSHKILQIFNSPQFGISVQRNLEIVEFFSGECCKAISREKSERNKEKKRRRHLNLFITIYLLNKFAYFSHT